MAGLDRDEIAKLEALYSANPEGRIFTHLAEAYRKAGEAARARELVERGLERHPEYSSAHVVLGRILLDLSELAAADTAFRRVLRLDPENRVALRSLAELAAAAGRASEAEDLYRELLLLDPGDEEAAEALHALQDSTTELGGMEPEAGWTAHESEVLPELADSGPATPLEWGESLELASIEPLDLEWSVADQVPALPVEPLDLEMTGEDPEPAAPEPLDLEIATGDPGPTEIEPLDLDIVPTKLEQDEQPEPMADLEPLDLDAFGWDEPTNLTGVEDQPLDELETEPPVDHIAELEDDLEDVLDDHPGDDLEDEFENEFEPETEDDAQVEPNVEIEDDPLAEWRFEEVPEEAEAPEGGELPLLDMPAPFDSAESFPAPIEGDAGSRDLEEEFPDSPAEPLLPDDLAYDLDQVGAALLGDDEYGPISLVTETMADLYASQGLVAQAAQVYRELLRSRPDDAVLLSKLDQVERAELAGGARMPAPVDDERAGIEAVEVEGVEDEFAKAFEELDSLEEVASSSSEPLADAEEDGVRLDGGEGVLIAESALAGSAVAGRTIGSYLSDLLSFGRAAAAEEVLSLAPASEPTAAPEIEAEVEPEVDEVPILLDASMEVSEEEPILLDASMEVVEETSPAAAVAETEVEAPLLLDESMVVVEEESGEMEAATATPMEDEDLEVFRAWLRNLKR